MTKHKTLFVHIGAHKTGTTAVQTHFAVYAPFFLCFGISYPRLGGGFRYRNQDIADDIRNSPGRFETIDRYLRSIDRSRQSKFLLSAEALHSLERAPEYFQSFSKVAQVRIIFFVRRQDRFLESIYRQVVKNESTAAGLAFRQFARARVRTSKSANRVDWLDRVTPWEKAFGRENISIVPYTEYAHIDSVKKMAKLLGVEAGSKLPRLDIGDNSSLSCETIEFLRRVRKLKIPFRKKKLMALDKLVEDPSSGYLGLRERQLLCGRFVESNQELGNRFEADVSGMLEFRENIEAKRKIFDIEKFDFEKMQQLAKKCGMLR